MDASVNLAIGSAICTQETCLLWPGRQARLTVELASLWVNGHTIDSVTSVLGSGHIVLTGPAGYTASVTSLWT